MYKMCKSPRLKRNGQNMSQPRLKYTSINKTIERKLDTE